MWNGKTQDLGLGALILVIAIGGFVFINPTGAPVTEGPGGMSWRSLPMIYSGLLLLLALIFIATTLFSPAKQPEDEEEVIEAAAESLVDNTTQETPEEQQKARRLSTIRRCAVVISLIVYSQLFDAFGFAMTTPVFLFAILYIFGRKKLIENLAVSLIGGVVLWVLFDYLLKMPLRGHVWDPLSPALTNLLRAFGG